ncbi:hypothetical protein PsorP6_006396 [Peronosclerospora sorghi]|uniref:Uncharacterized protein n=1 Tax=Peronosclerospora sorghi TaxID=230839 RepID=A0ACC0W1J6_9STRA|nr:hypothetical protein PsorP6_006396 [Peronosclerospora sorghi]
MQQQNLMSQAQFRAFMQQTQIQFNHMLTSQGPSRKKDSPTLDGKLNENYYAYKRDVMHADLSEFVEDITCNLEKSVQNWCRTISAVECAAAGVNKKCRLFKEKIHQTLNRGSLITAFGSDSLNSNRQAGFTSKW